MRVFSWIGGIVLVAVISTATAATLRAHNDASHSLVAAKPPVSAVNGSAYAGDPPLENHRLRPSPDPSPTPPAAAAAPPQQAAGAPPPAPPARPAPPAPPAIVVGSTQQALINQDRAGKGLGPLTWSSCLANVAAANGSRLAQQGWVPPYHTNGPTVDLGCRLGSQAGENVGYWTGGINDGQLNSMFMNSAEHYANIMGPYHYVATAWAVAANGYAYIAVEFS
jgi:uncharacterized protein YkwD